MKKQKLTRWIQLIVGFFFIGISAFGIISIYWPVITGEKASLGLEILLLLLAILGLFFGSIFVVVGIYSALKSYLSRGIMKIILGSIILILGIFIVILPNFGGRYFIIATLMFFIIPFTVSIIFLINGIYTIKKRKQRPAEKD